MSHRVAFVAVLGLLGSTAITTAEPFPQLKDNDEEETEDKTLTECPEPLRGVRLQLEPVGGGVTFKFTTSDKASLADLRVLLREAATLIEYHTKLEALHPESRQPLPDEVVIPAVDIDVKDIANGAQITVRPDDPDEVSSVRAQAKRLEEAWDESSCAKRDGNHVRT